MKKEQIDKDYISTEVIVPNITIFTNNVVDINEVRKNKERENNPYLKLLKEAQEKIDW